MPCPDCGSELTREQHICLPCFDQDDIDESRAVGGDIDKRTGKAVVYFINPAMAQELEDASMDVSSALDYIEGKP